MEVGGRTIVVEDDGTIIISQPAASAAVDVKESAEVEYLTGGCRGWACWCSRGGATRCTPA